MFIYVAARIRVLYLCLPYQEFKKLYNSLVCRTQVGGASVQHRLGRNVAGTNDDMEPPFCIARGYRARIFKCLWSPGIDSKE